MINFIKQLFCNHYFEFPETKIPENCLTFVKFNYIQCIKCKKQDTNRVQIINKEIKP